MNILLLSGSPHKNGTTARLIDAFVRGAQEAGHTVERVDASSKSIGGCLGCQACRNNGGFCVQKDDMEQIYPKLERAEGVVLVTPLYYFGMSAQLKLLLDRWYAVNPALRAASKKAALLSAGADREDWAMAALRGQYEALIRYLDWEDRGMLLVLGASTPQDLDSRQELEQARMLGKNF